MGSDDGVMAKLHPPFRAARMTWPIPAVTRRGGVAASGVPRRPWLVARGSLGNEPNAFKPLQPRTFTSATFGRRPKRERGLTCTRADTWINARRDSGSSFRSRPIGALGSGAWARGGGRLEFRDSVRTVALMIQAEQQTVAKLGS
ncbi:hypothetical protein AXG93_4751s1010 [Marchantia polymorpha subsp. ruderalis]|uniref:Uncharacterized protein n=1 Tax=Marchantia polymorpha subsp. ruderalis TaxID=1480154 RepID=A0A176VF28_MARPO|nr:hypothetical protein AXG93_4751s1010 [Marchantia polymorpha subsp. ruderalis]